MARVRSDLAAQPKRQCAMVFVIAILLSSVAQASDVDAHFGLTGGMSLINVQPGDNIYVTLQGRPSAGFYWILNQSTPGFSHLQLTNSSHTDVPPVGFCISLRLHLFSFLVVLVIVVLLVWCSTWLSLSATRVCT